MSRRDLECERPSETVYDAWTFVVLPPRKRPIAWACAPLFPPAADRCSFAVVLSVICMSATRAAKKTSPQTAPRPAMEAIIDRRRWAIDGWTILPAASDLQNVNDAADGLDGLLIDFNILSYWRVRDRRGRKPGPPTTTFSVRVRGMPSAASPGHGPRDARLPRCAGSRSATQRQKARARRAGQSATECWAAILPCQPECRDRSAFVGAGWLAVQKSGGQMRGWVSRVLGRNPKFRGVRKIARGDVVQFLRRAVAPEDGIAVGWPHARSSHSINPLGRRFT